MSDLDLASAPRLARSIDELQSGTVREVVVDLREVRFVDSAGMRVLVRAAQTCPEAGIRFRVRGVNLPVRRRLALTGLDRVLPID